MSAARQPTQQLEHVSLEAVDAVARAAHLWIRTLRTAALLDDGERLAVASGLVAGLCERLALDSGAQHLVAFVFTLLDGETDATMSVSRLMLDHPTSPQYRNAYREGRMEAAGIVQTLTRHIQQTVEC